MNVINALKRTACLTTLSLGLVFTSPAYAEMNNIDKALKIFQDEWYRVIDNVNKPDPKMQVPSPFITISFTIYQFDIPTFGLKAVEFYNGKILISYLNGTYLHINLERKYQFPPDVWNLKLDTIIACLMNPKDKLPPEYDKTPERFKEMRKIFWQGVEWTKFKRRPPFKTFQMYRSYMLLEPNTAFVIREGGNIEAVAFRGTISTDVFTKITDSVRYRQGG